MRVKRKAILTLLIALFTVSYAFVIQTQITSAQDGPDEVSGDEPQSSIEPEALLVLKEMSDALSSQKEFSFDAEITFDELLNSGQMVQLDGTTKMTVVRPDKVYAEFSGDRAERKAWYNGKELTILSLNNDFYGQLGTPDTIDKTMDFLMNNYDFTLPLADILHTDPYGSFSDGAVEAVELFDSKIRGKECSHIAFVGELIDWQLWVSNEDPALPCKLLITYKQKDGVPQYQAVFSNWNLNPDVPDSLFKPVLPKDAVKINFIDIRKQRGSE